LTQVSALGESFQCSLNAFSKPAFAADYMNLITAVFGVLDNVVWLCYFFQSGALNNKSKNSTGFKYMCNIISLYGNGKGNEVVF
jgi:hypothetical protein